MEALTALATNKVFVGVTILMMNIGSRFVIMDVGKHHEKILSNVIVKKIVIFCMFFVATRDIMTAIILTFAFVIILDGLLNENSKFNVLPHILKTSSIKQPIVIQPVTDDQYKAAMQTIEKFYSQKNIPVK